MKLREFIEHITTGPNRWQITVSPQDGYQEVISSNTRDPLHRHVRNSLFGQKFWDSEHRNGAIIYKVPDKYLDTEADWGALLEPVFMAMGTPRFNDPVFHAPQGYYETLVEVPRRRYAHDQHGPMSVSKFLEEAL